MRWFFLFSGSSPRAPPCEATAETPTAVRHQLLSSNYLTTFTAVFHWLTVSSFKVRVSLQPNFLAAISKLVGANFKMDILILLQKTPYHHHHHHHSTSMWFKGLDCLHQLLNEPEICLHRFWLYYWRGLIVQWWPLFTMNECWCRQNRPSNFLGQIGPNKAFSGQLGSNQGLFWSELTQGKLSLGQNWPKYKGFLGQTWQSGSKTVTLYSNQDRTISVSGKRVGLHIAKTQKKI